MSEASPEGELRTNPGADSDAEQMLLPQLVAHLREHRTRLRQEWANRIQDARLLEAMSPQERDLETMSVYDNYVEVLETGSVQALQHYARDLSERIIPRGVETQEVVGIVLLLRDVLARSLFKKYQQDALMHEMNGIDFHAASGTTVHAVGSGTVVEAGWGGAYGNQIVIKMNDGTYTQYGHLSSIEVSVGQTVTPGQRIGLSGATGNVTGAHLHFEARTTPEYGSDIDPVAYLRKHGVNV